MKVHRFEIVAKNDSSTENLHYVIHRLFPAGDAVFEIVCTPKTGLTVTQTAGRKTNTDVLYMTNILREAIGTDWFEPKSQFSFTVM